jgi:ubiquinone biosynthesis protein
VEDIISAELGQRLGRAFEFFDKTPLAAASLGQVHRATLRDGRRVVVKVQRPDVREQVAGDLDALADIAEFMDAHTELGKRYAFEGLLSEFRRSLLAELDYRLEADNLRVVHGNLRDFEQIVVPLPVDEYSSSRVLTMDYIDGTNVTALNAETIAQLDGDQLAEQLFAAYLKQVLVDGFFHADPHPGNIYITRDRRLALLDLGMVARVTPELQQQLLKMLLAISEGRGDEAADIVILMAEQLPHFDRPQFRRMVGDFVAEHQHVRVERLQTGRVVLEIQRIAGESGIRLPQQFTMLGKTLLNLDRVGQMLAPKFDPNAAIRRNALDLLRRRLLKGLQPGNLFQALLESGDFLSKLPRRLNTILDAFANRDIKLTVDAIDESLLIRGIHKVANRITAGLILAALIVGAAMLMRVETQGFTIFGYPAFAMILFATAAAWGFVLLFRIFFQDHRDEKEVEVTNRRKSR